MSTPKPKTIEVSVVRPSPRATLTTTKELEAECEQARLAFEDARKAKEERERKAKEEAERKAKEEEAARKAAAAKAAAEKKAAAERAEKAAAEKKAAEAKAKAKERASAVEAQQRASAAPREVVGVVRKERSPEPEKRRKAEIREGLPCGPCKKLGRECVWPPAGEKTKERSCAACQKVKGKCRFDWEDDGEEHRRKKQRTEGEREQPEASGVHAADCAGSMNSSSTHSTWT